MGGEGEEEELFVFQGYDVVSTQRFGSADGRVALDRGLRLAEKRCLPCPNRNKWMTIRDQLYEDVQSKG